MSVLKKLYATTVALVRGREGTVAITFSLSLLPLTVAVGAGFDYARATAERSTLQQGTDAGALAGIQALRKGQTLSDASTLVKQVVATNDVNPNASVTNVNLSADGTTLCVKSQSSINTSVMGVMGYKTMSLAAYACSAMRLDTYEIAFAMDNSASMANSAQSGGQTKMQAAQQAATALINALAPSSSGTGGVPVSYAVVPFTSSVNVDPANQNAAWIDTAGMSSIHWKSFTTPSPVPAGYKRPSSLFAMLQTMGVNWGGCVEERPSPYTTTDTKADANVSYDTLFAPFFWPDETDNNAAAQASPKNASTLNSLTFNNYVADDSGSCTKNDAFDKADQSAPGRGDSQTELCKYTSPIKTNGNKYYVTGQYAGPNAGCATKPLQPLNATASIATTSISNMSPLGDTILATGFMWAWRAISPNGPFASTGAKWSTSGPQQPKPYNYVDPTTSAVNHKVIILLTDGMDDWFGQDGDGYTQYTQYDNNKMVYNGFGYPQEGRLGTTTTSNARSLLDNTLSSACTNAKNAVDSNGNPAPVEIFTVGFLATDGIDSAGQTLLKNCATQDGGHSFIATNGDALVSVFQQIAASITSPRVAQ